MGKLEVLFKDMNKKFKEEVANKGILRIETEKIPFSSPRANYMLYGGIPRGRLIEFAGEESGGKTTTALDIVANAQRLFFDEWTKEVEELTAVDKPKKEQQTRLDYIKQRGPKQVVYLDCENTLDEDWALLLGVDVSALWVIKPQTQTAEQLFQVTLDAIETDEVGLAVIDSLGVMLSAAAYDKTMEDKTMGGIAAALTLFSKKAELACKKFNCTLIGINQLRDNMNSAFGGTTTTGGRGWRHNCSIRVMFQKGTYTDERGNELKRSAEEPAGNLVMINIIKNKVCKPDRRVGFYTLNYTEGIDVLVDAVELAIKYGIIQQAGSWFTFVDLDTAEVITDEEGEIIKIQGQANVVEYLLENDMFFDEILEKINSLIN